MEIPKSLILSTNLGFSGGTSEDRAGMQATMIGPLARARSARAINRARPKGARRRRDFTVLDRFWVLFITVSGVYSPHKELQTQWRFAQITQQKTKRAMQRHSPHTRQQCKLGNFNHNSRCVHNQPAAFRFIFYHSPAEDDGRERLIHATLCCLACLLGCLFVCLYSVWLSFLRCFMQRRTEAPMP